MASLAQTLNNVYQLFVRRRRGRRGQAGQMDGSQYPISPGGRSRLRSHLFRIPEMPVRPILGDIEISRELVEMRTWSYETRHWLRIMAQNCFQEKHGKVGSWRIVPEERQTLNPDVLAISQGLRHRYFGKTPVIGGQRLERATKDALSYGCAFLQLAFDTEGISRNDYCISRSMYMPSLSMFIDDGEQGQVQGYWQQAGELRRESDTWIHPIKILHFKFEGMGAYGFPATFQHLETWRKIKDAGANLEEAALNTSIVPWVHIMPPDQDERYKQNYQRDYEGKLDQGIVPNIYLMHGAKVEKASNANPTLKPSLDYFLSLRYQMLHPEFPIWSMPGLALEQGASKELANQPAMAYARAIAYLRAMLGEQILFAHWIEIALRRGIDFLRENQHFDVAWPEWVVSEMAEIMGSVSDSETESDDNPENDARAINREVNEMVIADEPETSREYISQLRSRSAALQQQHYTRIASGTLRELRESDRKLDEWLHSAKDSNLVGVN